MLTFIFFFKLNVKFIFFFQDYESYIDAYGIYMLVIVSLTKLISFLTITFLLKIIKFSFSNYSWLCCYMAQMNPLIGPVLKNNTVLLMAREWVRIFSLKNV